MTIYNRSKFIAGAVAIVFNMIGVSAAMSDNQQPLTGAHNVSHLPTKVIDLTQTIDTATPTYDGEIGSYKYQTLSTVAYDGYGSGAFFIHEHFGTHMDAPVHFCLGGKTIDQIEPSDLVLPAIVIDVQAEAKQDPDYLLSVEKIKDFERKNNIPLDSVVMLSTGWSKRYLLEGQYRNVDNKGIMHFPGFSLEAARYLIDKYKIKALGIDTLSIDHGPSSDFAVHKLVLSQGLFMVENLTNLDQLPNIGAIVVFAPLKIKGGTGSPARVLGLLP